MNMMISYQELVRTFPSTISAIAGKKAFIIIKLPSGLQVSLIIYIGIVADILRISLSLYKL